jgi:hypothetical protein
MKSLFAISFVFLNEKCAISNFSFSISSSLFLQLALQKRLAEVQAQDSRQRLSERHCVDLIMKLKELNKIQVNFTSFNELFDCCVVISSGSLCGCSQIIHSTSGKDYLTPDRVKKEVHDEIVAHNGSSLFSLSPSSFFLAYPPFFFCCCFRSGRINMTDLPGILGLDLKPIEQAFQKVQSEHKNVMLVGDLILTE